MNIGNITGKHRTMNSHNCSYDIEGIIIYSKMKDRKRGMFIFLCGSLWNMQS